MKQSRLLSVKPRMNYDTPSRREMLDQDLQIVRVTLATISDDVRGFSGRAADAIQEALKKLDCAQKEFGREPEPWRSRPGK